MPSLINSDDGVVSGSAGLKTTGSNDGILALQNNGTTAVTIAANGNVNFAVSGQRITGDFSNATQANRVMFQTSTANSLTSVAAIPNGTAQASYIAAFNRSTPDNSGLLYISATNTEAQIQSGITGTGTYLPMTFYTNGAENARIAVNGDFSFNSGYGSSAVAYGCRAWVNFNGASANPITPTGSGNVSSVSKTSTGVFTVNLTNAMPDTNFAFTATTRTSNTIAQGRSTATTTSTIPIGTATASGAGVIDTVTHVAVFR